MKFVVDTSVIIAVLLNEASKKNIIEETKGAELVAPASLHWEIANAFSAMFKRNRITLEEANEALKYYGQIPLRFYDIPLEKSLEFASEYDLYAYDAFFFFFAKNLKSPLLSLDQGLIQKAKEAGVRTIGV